MASLVLPQLDGPAETRKANKKKANKKKKDKKLNKAAAEDDAAASNAQRKCESPPEYRNVPAKEQVRAPAGLESLGLPLVIDGASWGERVGTGLGQNGYGSTHASNHQETLSVAQSSAPTLLSPSVAAAPAEDAGRAESAPHTHPGKPAADQAALPYCQIHGTATCRFDPACWPGWTVRVLVGPRAAAFIMLAIAAPVRIVRQARMSMERIGRRGLTMGYPRFYRSGWADLRGWLGFLIGGPPATGPLGRMWKFIRYGSPSATKKKADIATHDNELLATSTYLLCLFDSEDFHDSRFLLKSTKDHFPPITIRTHKLLIARSPFVASLLRASTSQPQGVFEIVALAGENFLLLKAFEVALQNLYGLPLLSQERLRTMTLASLGYTEDNIKMSPYPINTAMADFAMCYASSGAFLQQRAMVETGVQLIVENITWDNIELIFYFGFCIANFVITSPPAPTEPPTSSTPTNSTEAADQPEDTTDELQTKWAPHLLAAALDFVISHMPRDFTLYPQAHCKGMPDRIPEYLHTTAPPSLTNPKLADVKFGSFSTAEEEEKRGPETATVTATVTVTVTTSAVLVCLPYAQLRAAFVKMNARRVLSSDLAQAIVLERETRRLQALRAFARLCAQTGGAGAGVDAEQEIPSEILELGYAEFYTSRNVFAHAREEEATVSLEISLEREWIGLAVGEVMVKHRVLSDKKE
ncbi:uncharacterized protein ACLA_069230 [Aspergillus clavatus NRRL 1]|uniref:Uncharacterized protein n=1 Tax=Aspergillus clavatus (strain ATCC 1007 / CBS 513.65 / DSM 816 / NCTC 3887 / NRRL 1 / QM 1276 / 107) TaxID=344612 RepID=A1C673_ASPCL|nr:uncharacterized protein ACLA_069230 [Aspergillus clavatus NRRL 1]EAW13894.1 hypothetical protein ACLA_069230 [Aspergillus clavatus NRRL 1]